MSPAEAQLHAIVDAWEALPGGRQVRNRDVEEWLAEDMTPAINAIRGFLRRPKPDGTLPPEPDRLPQEVATTEVIDFLYKHGDLTYSAASSAVRLLTGNGYGFTRASSSTDAQPASTALVETLTIALQKAESVLVTYADPTGYTDAYGEQHPADAVQHEGLLAQEALDVVRSALSASQSTKGDADA